MAKKAAEIREEKASPRLLPQAPSRLSRIPKPHIEPKVAIAVIAIAAIIGTVAVVTLFAKPTTMSDLPAEDQITAKLGNELSNMKDVNSTELENLLINMVK